MSEKQMDEEQIEIITVKSPNEKYLKIRKIVSYILGALEALLVFRLIFKLLGANPESGFVSFIYTVTGVLLAPFSGIFKTAVTQGLETKSILEPANIIAMIVYAIIAYGLVRLIKIFTIPKENKSSDL